MKTIAKLLAAAAVAVTSSVCCLTAEAQTVNIDAALKYWEITDGLRQSKPLTDAVWDEFLGMPGNKVYVGQVFGADDLKAYRRAIEVVYMPQHDSLLQAKLKAQSWYYMLVSDYKQNEAQHRKFLQETSENPAYLELMYTLAYEYLPQRAHTKVQDLHLYYTALGNDATSQKEGIFFSINSAMNFNKSKDGVLEAHEIHHQIRPRKSFGEISEADKGLFWMLYSVQNEGIPDLIDKKAMVAAGGADGEGWKAMLYTPAPAVIQQLDTTIQALARNAGAPAHPVKYYSRMTKGSGGHLPGFYMATVIENNGFRKQLLDTADDPFAFIRLYQKAARKDKANAPVFSQASMAYLKQLEKKYTTRSTKKKETLTAQAK